VVAVVATAFVRGGHRHGAAVVAMHMGLMRGGDHCLLAVPGRRRHAGRGKRHGGGKENGQNSAGKGHVCPQARSGQDCRTSFKVKLRNVARAAAAREMIMQVIAVTAKTLIS
jgi:hypothetical protein